MRSLSICCRLFSGPQRVLFPNIFFSLCNKFHKIITNSTLINLNKLCFSMFSFYRNPKSVCITVYSNSHQAVFPKTTAYNLLQIFTSLFSWAIVALLWKESLQSVYNPNQILSNSFYLFFLFDRNPKTVCLTNIQTHIKLSFQKLLPIIFSRFLFHFFSGYLSREKWEVSQFVGDFFSRAKGALLCKSLFNLFTFLIKF